jgi:WD40 repeat protein
VRPSDGRDDPSGDVIVALAGEGRIVLAAQGLDTLRAWDLGTGKLLWSRHEASGQVHEVVLHWFDVSPDGKTVAASFTGNEVQLLDAQSGATLRSLGGAAAPVSLVRFAGADTVIGGAFDRTAHAWDPATGALRHSLHLSSDAVYSFAVSPDLRSVALGAYDGTVLWDPRSGDTLAALVHSGRSGAALFVGPVLLTGAPHGMQVWSASTHARIAALVPTGGGDYAVVGAAGAVDAAGHARDLFLSRTGGVMGPGDAAWDRYAVPGLLAGALAGSTQAPPGP